MTHQLFHKDVFVETAFERRFQATLRSALHKRSWHVIVADPGSGKTMGIREMVQTAGSPVILAVTAPKNNEDEQALGDQLFAALGLKLTGRWRTRKPKLMGHLHQFGTKLLIVDNAHDLSLEHLMFLKEITDQGRLQYDHPLGLCLVAAGRGNTIPLKEIFDQPETMWLQFRRRLDKLEPYCRIVGHTSEEVRDILAALETVYRELFPQLNLRQWSGAIYTWLTQPTLDPTNSGRVTMDYLMKLVTIALEWSYEASETNVRSETLEKAAELLVLRRDTLRKIRHLLWCRSLRRLEAMRWKTESNQSKRRNARFPGWWFLSNSNIFWRAVLHLWNALTVPVCAPSNRIAGFCGSNLTTNAKRILPIPDNDGPREKRTGMWLEDEAGLG